MIVDAQYLVNHGLVRPLCMSVCVCVRGGRRCVRVRMTSKYGVCVMWTSSEHEVCEDVHCKIMRVVGVVHEDVIWVELRGCTEKCSVCVCVCVCVYLIEQWSDWIISSVQYEQEGGNVRLKREQL